MIDGLMKDMTKESLARLTLLHMVKSGNHVAKKKGRRLFSSSEEALSSKEDRAQKHRMSNSHPLKRHKQK